MPCPDRRDPGSWDHRWGPKSPAATMGILKGNSFRPNPLQIHGLAPRGSRHHNPNHPVPPCPMPHGPCPSQLRKLLQRIKVAATFVILQVIGVSVPQTKVLRRTIQFLKNPAPRCPFCNILPHPFPSCLMVGKPLTPTSSHLDLPVPMQSTSATRMDSSFLYASMSLSQAGFMLLSRCSWHLCARYRLTKESHVNNSRHGEDIAKTPRL